MRWIWRALSGIRTENLVLSGLQNAADGPSLRRGSVPQRDCNSQLRRSRLLSGLCGPPCENQLHELFRATLFRANPAAEQTRLFLLTSEAVDLVSPLARDRVSALLQSSLGQVLNLGIRKFFEICGSRLGFVDS
jgi:hypothetical protein